MKFHYVSVLWMHIVSGGKKLPLQLGSQRGSGRDVNGASVVTVHQRAESQAALLQQTHSLSCAFFGCCLSSILWEGEGFSKTARAYWLFAQNTYNIAFSLAACGTDPETLGKVKILLSEVWSRSPDL